MSTNEIDIDLPLTPRSKTYINHYILNEQEYSIETGANEFIYTEATILTNFRRSKQPNRDKAAPSYINTIVRKVLLIIFYSIPSQIRNRIKETSSSTN